jgi:alkanesulfonate monooxygenase SsuD/methylene tetrahydromethanopterin reductase-like flavin-dependent oxidoreductase (luciferase family)
MKFDYFNELMPPEQWTPADERRVYAEALEQVVLCDEVGFTEVWVAEHQVPGHSHVPNPEILFGAWSQRTSRIRFGFGVQLLPASHPIAIAARTAMADLVTEGRIDVGTGRNADTYRQLGIDMAKSREMWEESIRLLPRLWTERDVTNLDGTFWPWDEPWTVLPRPVQEPHPPLWVAALSLQSAVRAAASGLGCMVAAYTGLEHSAGIAAAYKAAAAAPDDPIGQVRVNEISASSTWLCHEAGDEEANERFKRAVLDSRMIRIFRGDGAPANEVRLERGGLLPGYSDDEVFTKGGVRVGSPEEIVEHIRQLEAAGFDRVLVHMAIPGIPSEDVLRSIELFGSEVIPAFAKDREADAVATA